MGQAHWVLFVRLYCHCCSCLVSFIDVFKSSFLLHVFDYLPTCKCVHHVHVQCPKKPGVSIDSHGAGVRDSCSFHVATEN